MKLADFQKFLLAQLATPEVTDLARFCPHCEAIMVSRVWPDARLNVCPVCSAIQVYKFDPWDDEEAEEIQPPDVG